MIKLWTTHDVLAPLRHVFPCRSAVPKRLGMTWRSKPFLGQPTPSAIQISCYVEENVLKKLGDEFKERGQGSGSPLRARGFFFSALAVDRVISSKIFGTITNRTGKRIERDTYTKDFKSRWNGSDRNGDPHENLSSFVSCQRRGGGETRAEKRSQSQNAFPHYSHKRSFLWKLWFSSLVYGTLIARLRVLCIQWHKNTTYPFALIARVELTKSKRSVWDCARYDGEYAITLFLAPTTCIICPAPSEVLQDDILSYPAWRACVHTRLIIRSCIPYSHFRLSRYHRRR